MSMTKTDRFYTELLRQDLLYPRHVKVPTNLKPRHIRLLLLEAFSLGTWAQRRCRPSLRKLIGNAIWEGVLPAHPASEKGTAA